MIINFYPEQDNPILEKAAKEYKQIWKTDGQKIIATIEKVSGLKFKEKIVNALICDDVSFSIPLQLQSDIPLNHKKGALVHELCHRLIVGNNILLHVSYEDKNYILEAHKHIDLILYDIWKSLYGKDFARKEIEFEISLWPTKETSPYKTAWDWALSMTKENRQKEFNKYL